MTSTDWPDAGTLATIASIISAFAVTMLFFRVQRELQMKDQREINWIPWADRLLLAAAMLALLLVLIPLVTTQPGSWIRDRLPGPACGASVFLVACYPWALLAHYRLIPSGSGRGASPRFNPERSELVVVLVAVFGAAAIAFWSYLSYVA
jgi:hypothetical protein